MENKQQQGFSAAEKAEIEARIRQQHPDEEVVIVYEDGEPARLPALVAPPAETYAQPNFVQKGIVLAITLLAGLYLVNPTMGVFELIPDNLPLIGNLDEVAATAILISGLNFFGVNISWLASIFGPGLSKIRRRQ
jgi:hypothetical protein